ncbi:hypothetical protein [Metaclostridioides mangenotii]|uniref:hypothetical protein n=1 Tax=Metaclostridioides mangenotii TaxID=1540 RepID=UPI0026F34615|nr:hypothetical protein [Clostridioides mangenotii]
MIIIATRIFLVLIGIGALISAFLLGRYIESRRIEKFYKNYNKLVSENKKLKRDNEYFRSRLGLNNLTKDMRGK